MNRAAQVPLTAMLLAAALLPNVCWGDAEALINRRFAYRETILDQRAPPALERLVKEERTVVTFVEDLPATEGKTHFFIDADWTFDFSYKITPQPDDRQVAVTVSNLRLTFSERHVVRMPLAFHRADAWETQLLLHEFDHVAVSGDDRIRLLLDEVCGNLPTLTAPLRGADKPDEARLSELVNNEINRRQQAVIALVRANYVLLDKVSEHGQIPVPQRERFFAQLFTRANLQQNRFPYLQQVSKLLESEAYLAVKPKHLKADPAAR